MNSQNEFTTVDIAFHLWRDNLASFSPGFEDLPIECRQVIEMCKTQGYKKQLASLMQEAIELGVKKGIELGREQLMTEQHELAQQELEILKAGRSEPESQPELTSNDIVCAFVEIQNAIDYAGLNSRFKLKLLNNQTEITGIYVACELWENKKEHREIDVNASLQQLRAVHGVTSLKTLNSCLIEKES